MEFQETQTAVFLEIFTEHKELIRNSPGCQHLELWQDQKDPSTFFTYSFWDSEADLNNYRHSALFEKVWAQTKVLFAERPKAWTVQEKA